MLFEETLYGDFILFPTLMIVPSGIGCSIGGFSGDAMPSARLMAAASGCLITHPNVMNGAALYWNDPRIQYVEGYGLDKFAAGQIALKPVRQQKVGLLLDVGIEFELRTRHLHVADACRASLGLNVGPVVITEAPVDVRLQKGKSGSSWGEVLNPEILLEAGKKLKAAGATAIAIVTKFPESIEDSNLSAYRQGDGVDFLAGAEAVISHLLVRYLSIPCAHAPALNPLPIDDDLDPRVAGEELGHTFLACVLVGLSRAPDLIEIEENIQIKNLRMLSNALTIDDVNAVVAPQGALGGEAVLACIERGITIIAVENPGVMSISSYDLDLNDAIKKNCEIEQVITAKNYLEASGLILSMREGISVESLRRPIKQISLIR